MARHNNEMAVFNGLHMDMLKLSSLANNKLQCCVEAHIKHVYLFRKETYSYIDRYTKKRP